MRLFSLLSIAILFASCTGGDEPENGALSTNSVVGELDSESTPNPEPFDSEGYGVLDFTVLGEFEYPIYVKIKEGEELPPIPDEVRVWDGKKVAITGFMNPVRFDREGVSEFLLVKDILGDSVSNEEARSAGSFAYLLMNVTGGLLGLLCFAPLSMMTSRRKAFVFYHVGAIIFVPVTFLTATTYTQALVLLPIMAFFVVGMHAGYAVYFPELFPTRLRATGASFCFNVGRLLSAVMILVRAELRAVVGLREAVSIMAGLFFFGLVLLIFAPETKGKGLPE